MVRCWPHIYFTCVGCHPGILMAGQLNFVTHLSISLLLLSKRTIHPPAVNYLTISPRCFPHVNFLLAGHPGILAIPLHIVYLKHCFHLRNNIIRDRLTRQSRLPWPYEASTVLANFCYSGHSSPNTDAFSSHAANQKHLDETLNNHLSPDIIYSY